MALMAMGAPSLVRSRRNSSEIGFAFPQRGGRHLQGNTDRMVGGQPAFPNDLVPADTIIGTEPQPGNKMVLGLTFAHVVSGFADDCRRGHDIDAVDPG